MCVYLLGEHIRGPYRDAHIQPPYISAVYMQVSWKGIKKRRLCESPLNRKPNKFQLMNTTSKDSQFLEVCREPILTVSFTRLIDNA